MRFQDKVVIVTGGGQGIGMAIARAFAAEGAKVAIADADREAGQENADYIAAQSGEVISVESDISQETDVCRLFETVTGHWGKVDILINNAGIGYRGNIFKDTMEPWDRVLAVNLRGAYLCAKYAAPWLAKSKVGAIVNIASTRALMSEPGWEAYAASKGGLLSMTHALAISLGEYGIRVNAICPGWIEVSDWKKLSEKTVPVHREADKAQHPAGRVGKPEDIAAACLYLVSEEAGFITGTHLVVDGGITRKMIYVE